MKHTSETIERDVAALTTHGHDLRRESAELSRTVKELLREAARLTRVLATQKLDRVDHASERRAPFLFFGDDAPNRKPAPTPTTLTNGASKRERRLNYAPNRKAPLSARVSRPGKALWSLRKHGRQITCEPRGHGEYGWGAQLFRDGEFYAGRRFDLRADVVVHAEGIRQDVERDGWRTVIFLKQDVKMTTPKNGDTKPCPRTGCSDTAIFSDRTPKPGTGAAFGGAGSLIPPAAEYVPAWSCESCGYYEPVSN